MNYARTLALTLTGAVLFAAPPAAADGSPPPSTPLTTAPPPAAYPPGTYPAPGAYPPGTYPALPPGAYYGPPSNTYYVPPPSTYYAPLGAYVGPPPMERRSVGAMVGGIVSLSAGGLLLFSSLFVALGPSCIIAPDGFAQCTTNVAALVGLAVGGLAALAAGIPLVVYGAKKVPVSTSASGNTFEGALPQWAGATPWRWSF